MEELLNKWDEIKDILKTNMGLMDHTYNSFIQPLTINDVIDNTIYICVPDSLGEAGINFIKSRYDMFIISCIEDVLKINYKIEYILESKAKELKNSRVSSYINGNENNVSHNSSETTNIDISQKKLNANLNDKYTFDTFVNGDNSNLAYSSALAVAENPGKVYNPFFIYGGPGLGKTHLMQSIGNAVLEKNNNMNILYITSEFFMNDFINSIRQGDQAKNNFKNKYRNVDILLIDDIQFIDGKTETMEEFFHTFNALYSVDKQIVITSDKHPKELQNLDKRIETRFDSGLITDIGYPKYETRYAIIQKKAESANVHINDEIIDYIAANIKSSVRELEGALTTVIAVSRTLKPGDEIDLESAKESLKSFIVPRDEKTITPELILKVVSDYYDISSADILSSKRDSHIVTPRHVAMYLCKNMTNLNKVAIGKFFGNRNHATVISGCNKIASQLKDDEQISNTINVIKKILQS